MNQKRTTFPGPAWAGWDVIEKGLEYAVLASKAAAVLLVVFVILWCFFSLPL